MIGGTFNETGPFGGALLVAFRSSSLVGREVGRERASGRLDFSGCFVLASLGSGLAGFGLFIIRKSWPSFPLLFLAARAIISAKDPFETIADVALELWLEVAVRCLTTSVEAFPLTGGLVLALAGAVFKLLPDMFPSDELPDGFSGANRFARKCFPFGAARSSSAFRLTLDDGGFEGDMAGVDLGRPEVGFEG